MSQPSEISLEFMRRELMGESREQLLSWAAAALQQTSLGESPLSSWQIRSAIDALATKEPMRYLVDQMLAYPSLCILYGGPGSLKSMLLADLAVCVASGKRWLENMPGDRDRPGVSLATEAHPVLWVDADNGPRRTDIRIGALLRGHMLPSTTSINYISMPFPALDASSTSFMTEFIDFVKRNGFRLVIIDNLGLITGNVEENSAAMASVMGRLRRLAEEAECAVVLIHHQRKSAANGDAKGVRKGETLRGHSSIEAALDLALQVERKPGTDSIAIIPTKVRDFLSFDILGAQFTYDHFEGTRDLERARFFSTVTQTPEETAEQALRAAILEEVKIAPGITTRDLVANVRDTLAADRNAKNVGVNTARGTIKKMVDDGVLKCTGTSQAYRYYNA